MDNREILEKYKSSNDKYDEGQQYFEGKADSINLNKNCFCYLCLNLTMNYY